LSQSLKYFDSKNLNYLGVLIFLAVFSDRLELRNEKMIVWNLAINH